MKYEFSRSDQELVERLLTGFGVRPDDQERYLQEVGGMIDLALDDYFRSREDAMMEP